MVVQAYSPSMRGLRQEGYKEAKLSSIARQKKKKRGKKYGKAKRWLRESK